MFLDLLSQTQCQTESQETPQCHSVEVLCSHCSSGDTYLVDNVES